MNNRLNNQQAFQLGKWVEANWQGIVTGGMSKDKAASLAQKALKFEITAHNLARAAKAVGHENWPNGPKGGLGKGSAHSLRVAAAVEACFESFDPSLAEKFRSLMADSTPE